MTFLSGAVRLVELLAVRRPHATIWTRLSPLQRPRKLYHSWESPSKQTVPCLVRGRLRHEKRPSVLLQFSRNLQTSSGSSENERDPPSENVIARKAKLRKEQPRLWKRWSAAETARLTQMHEDGHTWVTISHALGRSRTAVTHYAKRKGLSTPMPSFTKEEDELILAAGAAKVPWREVYTQMPHHRLQTLSYRYRKLLHGDAVVPGSRTRSNFSRGSNFSREEDECILHLRGERKTWTEILKHLPGRKDASNIQLRYERIVPRADWIKVRHSSWWSEEENERFGAMHDAGHSAKEMAAALGRCLRSVYARIRDNREQPTEDTPVTRRKFWTQKETKRLLEMEASGRYTLGEMAKILDKSYGATNYKLSMLGVGRKDGKNRRSAPRSAPRSEPYQRRS